MSYRFPGQLLRFQVRVTNYKDFNEMLAAFTELVTKRPGWLFNSDEENWYFNPLHDGTIPSDEQITTFSEADIKFPEDQYVDEYYQPVMDEMASLLEGNPQWVYDDGEKGWIFQSKNKSFIRSFISSVRGY